MDSVPADGGLRIVEHRDQRIQTDGGRVMVHQCDAPFPDLGLFVMESIDHDVQQLLNLLGASLFEAGRLDATTALGRVAEEYPSIAVEIVDDVTALFEVENYKLRNNAIALISDVATLHTDVVEPYTEEITELLAVDDAYARINASAVLARIAQDFPETVEQLTPTFIELLADADPRVRENACWALGYLGAQEAQSSLEERAHGDESADVRTRASWALARIDEQG